MNLLEKIIVGAALLFNLSGDVSAKGYNALETGVSKDGIRSRLLTNYDLGPVGYHGLNEVTDLKNAYGWHVFTLGKGKTRPALTLKTDHGIFDRKVGIRDESIPAGLGGYGTLDLMFNQDELTMALFFGKDLGKGKSLEFFQETGKPDNEKPWHYTELQYNQDIGRKLAAFARIEADNFRQPRYLAGMTKKF